VFSGIPVRDVKFYDEIRKNAFMGHRARQSLVGLILYQLDKRATIGT